MSKGASSGKLFWNLFRALGIAFVLFCTSADGQVGCHWVIRGYQHPFDVMPNAVCNMWGFCQTVMQQVPCQHPLMACVP